MFNTDKPKGSFDRRLYFARVIDALEEKRIPVGLLEDFREIRDDDDWRFVRNTCPMKSDRRDGSHVSHLEDYYKSHKPTEWRKVRAEYDLGEESSIEESGDPTPGLAFHPGFNCKLSDLIGDGDRLPAKAEKVMHRFPALIEEAIRAALDRTFREAVIREARIPHGMTIPTATDLAEVAWIAARSRRKNSGKLASDHIDEKQILELEAVTELAYGLCLLRGKEKSGVAVKHVRDALRSFDRVPSFALEKERALIQAQRAADAGDISKATRIAEEYALDRTAGRTSKLTEGTQSLLSELAIPEAVVAEGLEMTVGLPYIQRSQLTDAAVGIFEGGLLESRAEYDLYRWATVEKANCLRIATEYQKSLVIAQTIDMETPFKNAEICGEVFWKRGVIHGEAGKLENSLHDLGLAVQTLKDIGAGEKLFNVECARAALLGSTGDPIAFYLFRELAERRESVLIKINASIAKYHLEVSSEEAPYKAKDFDCSKDATAQAWNTYLLGWEQIEEDPGEAFRKFRSSQSLFAASMQIGAAGYATLQASIAALKAGNTDAAYQLSAEAASFYKGNNAFGGRLALAAAIFLRKTETVLTIEALTEFSRSVFKPYRGSQIPKELGTPFPGPSQSGQSNRSHRF